MFAGPPLRPRLREQLLVRLRHLPDANPVVAPGHQLVGKGDRVPVVALGQEDELSFVDAEEVALLVQQIDVLGLPSEDVPVERIDVGSQRTVESPALERQFREVFGGADVVWRTKSNFSAPADASIVDEIKAWQAVVAGVGD